MKFLNLSILILLFSILYIVDGGSVGVNYGRLGNDLPPPREVVQLLKSQGFHRVKIFDVNPDVLRALSGSGIKVTVCLPNENITLAAKNAIFADKWVTENVVAPYRRKTNIVAIAIGNEILDDKNNPGVAAALVDAMINIHKALVAHNLDHAIKVSSPLSYGAISNSYPPHAATFKAEYLSIIERMLNFLSKIGSPLMVNVYPYFAYANSNGAISLKYALFQNTTVVPGPNGNYRYTSLFDAMVDAVYAAMSKLKYDRVPLVISETGWPSMGEPKEPASIHNAATYNQNLVNRVLSHRGTPLRPKANLTVYIFALFNENSKPGLASEKHFGLFYPNKKKVYDIVFTPNAPSTHENQIDPPTSHVDNLQHNPTGQSAMSELHAVPLDQESHPHVFPTTHDNELRVVSPGGRKHKRHSWCMAKPDASNEMLQKALDWTCNQKLGGANCNLIQPNQRCYEPNTLQAHASHAFNSYYQMHKRGPGTCIFDGTAKVVYEQPSFGNCKLHFRE